MSEFIIEEWKVIDRWWTDTPTEREFKVLADKTVWMRERQHVGNVEWSEWVLVRREEGR